MILLIDNYDSFSYNLYQLIGEFNDDIVVIRNDEKTIKEIEDMRPQLIIISPGPGKPKDAGICIEVIKYFKGKIPIFGVCLGYQAICEAYGATVTYAKKLMHGKTSAVNIKKGSKLYESLGQTAIVGRYHSLAVDEKTLPDELEVVATTKDGEIMAVEDNKNKVYGVQFHPESILTNDGNKIIRWCASGVNPINGLTPEAKKEATIIKEAIKKLSNKQDIGYDMAKEVMNEIMSGLASDIQKSAYLTALSMKGETIDEITASAEAMRNHCIKLLHDKDVLEIVGTGGDGSNSFNISTTSSIVIAAAEIPVAKHGNRAASSKCGAADVLEALGVKINIPPEKSTELLNRIGICFLFAQNYHIAMKYVAPIRKELGIRTVFNILGPLSNPAGANIELMGVYDKALVEPLARVLNNLGVKRALVVYGEDKLDEISISADTVVCEINDGKFTSYVITPEQFGLERCNKENLVGGTPEENAKITLAILNGEKGPRRNAVVLNAGAAIYLGGKAENILDGIRLAEEIIDSGKAKKKLEEFIKYSNE